MTVKLGVGESGLLARIDNYPGVGVRFNLRIQLINATPCYVLRKTGVLRYGQEI